MKQEEMNANVRTLIVCFVVAVFALIPLRFYEVGQMMSQAPQTQVLGARSEAVVSSVPAETGMKLEAPYDQIEGKSEVSAIQGECVTKAEVNDMISEINKTNIDESKKVEMINELAGLSICQ